MFPDIERLSYRSFNNEDDNSPDVAVHNECSQYISILKISILYLFRENGNSTTKPLKYCGTDFSDVLLNRTQKPPRPSNLTTHRYFHLCKMHNTNLTILSLYMQQLLTCLLRASSCYHSYDKNVCDTSLFGVRKQSGNLTSSFHSCTNTMFSSYETCFSSVKSFQQAA